MKVILQKDVINLGDAGDVKEVADGYARNYLFPNRLASRADKGTTKVALHNKRLADLKKEKRAKAMKDVNAKLDGQVLTIPVKVGENEKLFGSVTSTEIANRLKNQTGVEIDKRKIELPESIKALGDYKVKIRLAEGISSQITLNITKEA